MEYPDNSRNKKFRILFPLFAVAALFAFSAAVMLLWNAIIPAITSFSAIGYWQAMGLLVLCRILFGGMRFGGAHHHSTPMHGLRERFMHMNPDERKAFRDEWKARCQTHKPD